MVSDLAPYGTLKDYVEHEGPLCEQYSSIVIHSRPLTYCLPPLAPPLARSVLIQIIDGLLVGWVPLYATLS